MRAISIRQPWAWAIVHAGKRIENRSWRCDYRGPIAIHAAKGMTLDEYEDACDFMRDIGVACVPRDKLQRGGIIGVATVISCVRKSSDPWFMGPWGIYLADVRPVEFFPCRGQLGIFDIQYEAPCST